MLFTCNLSLVTAQKEYIVTVNPTDGIISKIDSIPGVRYLLSSSTYNQTNKEYTVLGTWQPGQSPTYLYTLNVLTGNIISSPQIAIPNTLISLQYSRSTGILYGIVSQNNTYYLATVNKISGTYSLIKDLPGINGIGNFTIDEANQRLFLSAVDNNPNYALWTIDLANGTIIYHVSTQNIFDLRYDNVTHKLYALTYRAGPTPGSNSIFSICTVEHSTGFVTNIADLPGITGVVSGDHGTYNENQHLYLFSAKEQAPDIFLYSVDVNSGNIVSKAYIDAWNRIDRDNLIFFRYDNTSGKLYALLWEAKTIPPTPIDSTCKLYLKTKIYPSPFNHTLIIDKNPTTCKVVMNLYNMIGQLILKGNVIKDGYNEIHLPGVSAGIYYYELISDKKIVLSGKVLNY